MYLVSGFSVCFLPDAVSLAHSPTRLRRLLCAQAAVSSIVVALSSEEEGGKLEPLTAESW